MVLGNHVENSNHYISTTTVLIATKHGRMVYYFEQLPHTKLLYLLVTWSCKTTWEIKAIISPLPQFPNLAGCWLTSRSSYPFNHVKFKQVFLLYHLKNWKKYISTLTKPLASKHGRLLTSRRRINMQTLKLSPTNYLFSFTPTQPWFWLNCHKLFDMYYSSIDTLGACDQYQTY